MLQALLFDCDGTLADTEREGHRVAFNQAFRQFELDWYWDEALYGRLLQVTGGKERIRLYMQSYLDCSNQQVLDESQVVALHRAKSIQFKEILKSGEIALRPGVLRLIKEAKLAGIRIAVVTTTTAENVIALLERQLPGKVDNWVELIAAGDVVENKKPAPDIYLWALQQMGLQPGQCLAIEDSRNGLLAATRAGIESTLITVNDYTQMETFSEATMVVDHLGDSGQPYTAQKGTMAQNGLVDLPLLKSLHGHNSSAPYRNPN